jgi:hypothetical protein
MKTDLKLVPISRLRKELHHLGFSYTGKSRSDILTELICLGLYEVDLRYPAKPRRIDTSTRKDDLSNVYIGNGAGLNEVGNHKLYIANSSTDNPLIGGDFRTRKVNINNCLNLQQSPDFCADTVGEIGDIRMHNGDMIVYRGDDINLHKGWYPIKFGSIVIV